MQRSKKEDPSVSKPFFTHFDVKNGFYTEGSLFLKFWTSRPIRNSFRRNVDE
jgi:hypothetical protein